MQRGIRAKVLIGAVAAVAAVGALAGPATAKGAAPQPVATVTGAGVTVTFLSQADPDGTPRIGLRETGRMDRTTDSPLPALIGQRLTSQEIYLALAPQGAKAPEALVRVQAAEAQRLGRDADVRSMRAEAFAPERMGVSSLDSCINLIAPSTPSGYWLGVSGSYYTSGSFYKYVGSVSTYETTSTVVFGACNESSTYSMSASYAYNQRWNSLGWQDSDSLQLPVGWYAVWYYQWGGYDAGGNLRGASYRVNGSSSDAFSLVTATAHLTTPK